MATVRISFRWDLDRVQWNRHFAAAPKSNLLQTWAYGTAKAAVEGWIPRRGIVLKDGVVLGTLVVLEKRWFGLFGLNRINRGPIWVAAAPADVDLDNVLDALRRELGLRHQRLLMIAPNLPADKAILSRLTARGFRKRHAQRWNSMWIDLSVPAPKLRARLKGKWRNQLSGAERKGVSLHLSEGEAEFAWMLQRSVELMTERSFNGPSPALLTALRSASDDTTGMVVLQAMLDQRPVAGIAVTWHGSSSTYLLGWNGAEGRKANANNFLLWHAVVEMQRRGIRWFDMGGINEEKVPGIADFKLGLNGDEYRLVGEYVSC